MASVLQTARLAALQAKAALAQAGYSAVPILSLQLLLGDDPDEILAAVQALCGGGPGADKGGNGAQLKAVHGSGTAPTHVIVPADLVHVPKGVVASLATMLDGFAPTNGAPRSEENRKIGWLVAVDRSDPDKPVLTVRLSIPQDARRRPDLASHEAVLNEGLGVPVSLEIGTIPGHNAANLWARQSHSEFSAGMNIGSSATRGGAIAMPVRLRNGSPGRFFLTAGHILPNGDRGTIIRQPAASENRNRQIGFSERVEYESDFDAVNYFDVALINAANHPPSLQFGSKKKYQLLGVYEHELEQDQIASIYGAASGLLNVRINFVDVETTMLSTGGKRLIYRDVVEFSNHSDNTELASRPGDSGSPLLIGKDNKYYVAGLIIGGGNRVGGDGLPRSYAVPIRRVLDHFQVEPL